MAFKKGKSGNPSGRPKGATNKVGRSLRERIEGFLESNFEKMIQDIEGMDPRDRVKAYCDLLQYTLSKMRAVDMDTKLNTASESIVYIGNKRLITE